MYPIIKKKKSMYKKKCNKILDLNTKLMVGSKFQMRQNFRFIQTTFFLGLCFDSYCFII